MPRWAWMLACHAAWYQAARGFSFVPRRAGGVAAAPSRQRRRCAGSGALEGRSHPGILSEGGRRPRRRAPLVAPLSASSSSASSAASAAVIDFYDNLDQLYDRSSAIKCPFFRRRAADLIDDAAMVAQFLLIRHKSLPGVSDLFLDGDLQASAVPEDVMSVFSAPGCKPLGRHIQRHSDGTARKTRDLPLSEVAQRIRSDWTGGAGGEGKGYYITGRLDSTVYRDDCLFTGPDPDMPVRGLRKYLSAAAHLFDPRESSATLLSMTFQEDGGGRGCGTVEVRWRLGGVIMLPWHPTVEPWTGTTTYHLDEEGLVYLHEEEWDISVWRAFICTLFPEAKDWRIWSR